MGNIIDVRRTFNLVLPLAVLVLVGCGTDRVGRASAVADQLYDYLCTECPAAVGRMTTADCNAFAESVLLSPTEEQCVRNVYDDHPDELAPSFDCSYEATVEYDRCMRTATTTCPGTPSDLMLCANQYSTALMSCPLPSSATLAELQVCTS